jgi:tetratricopeptide (TPR) repeat protein
MNPAVRRWGFLVTTVVALGLLAAGSRHWIRVRESRFAAALQDARTAMAENRLAVARKTLLELATAWPGRGEVLVLLGQCEEAMGRPARAVEVWGKVPTADPAYFQAAESRAILLTNLGRYDPAERLLRDCLARVEVDSPAAFPLLRALARVLRLQGRFDEVGDVLRASWLTAPDRASVLEELWQVDTEPVPLDGWKLFLDQADDADDRVWLGRARHALQAGRLDEARALLNRCLQRRNDDAAVWRARLDLALAADDPDWFWESAARLAAAAVRPEELATLRAWLAERGGDRETRQRAWQALLEVRPASTQALERLAVFAREAGAEPEADRLLRRKAEIDRAKDAIDKLGKRALRFRPFASELAQHCAVLGREFDSHAWSLLDREDRAGASDSPTEARAPEPARAANSLNWCTEQAWHAFLRIVAAGTGQLAKAQADSLASRLADLRGTLTAATRDVAAVASMSSPPGQPWFEDQADSAGLRFVFDNGKTPLFLLPETLSGGVALIDYDSDGWLDVYCVQGGAFEIAPPKLESGSPPPIHPSPAGDRLFRNRGDGTFEDATAAAGVDCLTWGRGYGMGLAVGDYDNDGDADLFITRLHSYQLLHNRGDGTFEDATDAAGLGGRQQNPTSAAFADLDADGDLDLYVCHYMTWDPANPKTCRNEQWGQYYCDPAHYESAADRIFRNDGGRFVDVTETAGFTDADGRGLGVVAADLDDDNRIDLYVANDGTANFLFLNQGNFRFEDVALSAGVAGNSDGGFQAGMGVAAADLDGDGRLDLLVTNLYLEGASLFRNLGGGTFADCSRSSGLFQQTRLSLGFGIAVLDARNDGLADVVIANGHVNDFRPLYPFQMTPQLLEGTASGRLVEVSQRAGEPWRIPRLGRGLAAGDLDNDGRIDVLIVHQNEPLAYLRNRTEKPGHFITLRLEGTRSNRDGVGARVTISSGGRRQTAQRVGGGSYLSAGDPRLHFGLGDADRIDWVEVRWPSGRIDRWEGFSADTGFRLREAEAAPLPLIGFHPNSASQP